MEQVRISRDQRALTAWMLAVSILMYPLLTYLSTPLVKSHGNGQWTIVCTLQGERAAFIDFESDRADGADSCPALKLLQLVTTGSVSAPPPVPRHKLLHLSSSDQSFAYHYRAPHFSVFPSRAPPFA